MEIISARNVNDAYTHGLRLLRGVGRRQDSRAGPVLVAPCPVVTVYDRPTERVLFDPVRDANPFFHLFESLWMLSGRRDACWLDRFVKDFSSRFAEDDGVQHGAYGYRWRRHFDMEGGSDIIPDQIETVVRLLRADPDDRRVVLTMWDPVADLGVTKRDIPCNTHAYLRVRRSSDERHAPSGGVGVSVDPTDAVLDITVCCRSNDAVWGCYGANAVHFSVLQEYVAGRLGVGVGRYYQVSNNFHVYVDVLDRVGEPTSAWPYSEDGTSTQPMGTDWERWDEDLARFMAWTDRGSLLDQEPPEYNNTWFRDTADPLFAAHWCWKQGYHHDAHTLLSNADGMAPDWRVAANEWLGRRSSR